MTSHSICLKIKHQQDPQGQKATGKLWAEIFCLSGSPRLDFSGLAVSEQYHGPLKGWVARFESVSSTDMTLLSPQNA